MPTYIALLRGINVSGQKKIKMAELRTQLEALDFQAVQTYIQSGNIVFQSPLESLLLLKEKIATMILTTYGWEVPILVLQVADLQNAVDGYPWTDKDDREPKDIYLTFLEQAPEPEYIEAVAALAYPGEEYVLQERLIYFYAEKGYGRAKMNNNFFEKKLKVKATTRNWRTTAKLLEMGIDSQSSN